jgi:hypothetical protein
MAGLPIEVLEKAGPVFGAAENVPKKDPSVDNHLIRQMTGRGHWEKYPTLCSGSDPIMVMPAIIDGFARDSVRITKFNCDGDDLTWRFPMVINMDGEVSSKLECVNRHSIRADDWLPIRTDNRFGHDMASASAGNISPLDSLRMSQLGAANQPNRSSECRDQDSGNGANRPMIRVNEFSRAPIGRRDKDMDSALMFFGGLGCFLLGLIVLAGLEGR